MSMAKRSMSSRDDGSSPYQGFFLDNSMDSTAYTTVFSTSSGTHCWRGTQSTPKELSKILQEGTDDPFAPLELPQQSKTVSKSHQQEKYQNFILKYNPQDESKPLLNPVKLASMGFSVVNISTVKGEAHGMFYLARVSTHRRYRLISLTGGTKGSKTLLTATEYNKRDRQGLQIAGVDGLTIYCNDKSTECDFNTYSKIVDRAFSGILGSGTPIGQWSLSEGQKKQIGKDINKYDVVMGLIGETGVNPTVLLNNPSANFRAPAPTSDAAYEFDVIKKRRLIESSVPDPDESSQALADFEDFERNVLPSLINIHANDQQNKTNELIRLEEELRKGNANTNGGVYVARCNTFAMYLKIGATRRSEPTQRLYEISRYVPEPFQLVQWIPSSSPFQLEAKIHRQFDSQRLKANGAGTEFFLLEETSIRAFFLNEI